MNIHEYQAKNLFQEYHIPVPLGGLASTPKEARLVADSLPGPVWVVKAQIHAGGRGKGGGVQVVHTAAEAETAATQILGMTLVTHQTGPQGKLVRKVWIEQGTDISSELYLAVVLDRGAECLAVIASPAGGMDIEEVAAKTPERIFTTAGLIRSGLNQRQPLSQAGFRFCGRTDCPAGQTHGPCRCHHQRLKWPGR